MVKRHQLNINIDEKLLKELKFIALQKNLKLNVFIKQVLSDSIRSNKSKARNYYFSEKDSLNFSNFIKTLFQKISTLKFSSQNEAFDSLINFLQHSDHWGKSDSLRLKGILLDNEEPWDANEFNIFYLNENHESLIYILIRDWVGSNEFPSQELILDLGSSLVPIIENNIKMS